jgi:secreted trypsin-like serine protease
MFYFLFHVALFIYLFFVTVAKDIECGLSSVRETKIVGGSEAERGEFPFMVSLRHASRDRHYCGGAILDRTHVITAAHCLER